MEELLTKYEAKLKEMQADFDENYENKYYEGCDRLDEAIEVLQEVVKDLSDKIKG